MTPTLSLSGPGPATEPAVPANFTAPHGPTTGPATLTGSRSAQGVSRSLADNDPRWKQAHSITMFDGPDGNLHNRVGGEHGSLRRRIHDHPESAVFIAIVTGVRIGPQRDDIVANHAIGDDRKWWTVVREKRCAGDEHGRDGRHEAADNEREGGNLNQPAVWECPPSRDPMRTCTADGRFRSRAETRGSTSRSPSE